MPFSEHYDGPCKKNAEIEILGKQRTEESAKLKKSLASWLSTAKKECDESVEDNDSDAHDMTVDSDRDEDVDQPMKE